MSAWANDYVGIPYVVNGRDRTGLDCWGLLILAFREQRGIELPDWRVSPRRDAYGELAEAVSVITRRVGESLVNGAMLQLAEPEPWAIVTCHRHKAANHVGVCLDGYVLHCSEATRGVVCEPASYFNRMHAVRSYLRWQEGRDGVADLREEPAGAARP